VLDGVQIPHVNGQFSGKKAAHCKYRHPDVSCANTAEPIDMPFGLRWVHGSMYWIGDAHWRHLADTTELFVCGGDAAMSSHFDHLLTIPSVKVKFFFRHRCLHFARVVDDVKCIVVTRGCVSVCVCICPRPHAYTIARARM